MQEVVNKINELVTLLEQKISTCDKREEVLSKKKKEIEKQEEINIATTKRLAAIQRVYKKYEDFDKEVKAFNQSRKDYKAEIDLINSKQDILTKKETELVTLEKQLDKRKDSLNKQSVALKEKEANFDKKREDIKSMISGQAIKDIFK
jgi:chaperonin cofactor prefoldin